MNPWQLRKAARIIHTGGVIAYPTEAVYGLGCDPLNPQAVLRLLELKQRPMAKGLILIAADLAQLEPYIEPLTETELATVKASWPGPVTWLLPAKPETPRWLRGEHDCIAVRVTAHPLSCALCRAAGQALVSTSANPSGQSPARSALTVRRYFADRLDLILPGSLDRAAKPSTIRDLRSGRVLRS